MAKRDSPTQRCGIPMWDDPLDEPRAIRSSEFPEDRSNLHFIFPTLAVQLAQRYTEFRSMLVPLALSDPRIAYQSLYNQMNKLIV